MRIYLVSIEEDNANISRIDAGQFLPLTFRTLVILYPTGVSYPNPSGWERTHIGNAIPIYIHTLFNSY